MRICIIILTQNVERLENRMEVGEPNNSIYEWQRCDTASRGQAAAVRLRRSAVPRETSWSSSVGKFCASWYLDVRSTNTPIAVCLPLCPISGHQTRLPQTAETQTRLSLSCREIVHFPPRVWLYIPSCVCVCTAVSELHTQAGRGHGCFHILSSIDTSILNV